MGRSMRWPAGDEGQREHVTGLARRTDAADQAYAATGDPARVIALELAKANVGPNGLPTYGGRIRLTPAGEDRKPIVVWGLLRIRDAATGAAWAGAIIVDNSDWIRVRDEILGREVTIRTDADGDPGSTGYMTSIRPLLDEHGQAYASAAMLVSWEEPRWMT